MCGWCWARGPPISCKYSLCSHRSGPVTISLFIFSYFFLPPSRIQGDICRGVVVCNGKWLCLYTVDRPSRVRITARGLPTKQIAMWILYKNKVTLDPGISCNLEVKKEREKIVKGHSSMVKNTELRTWHHRLKSRHPAVRRVEWVIELFAIF